jgi:6-phospho-beta-glucosidase
MEYSLLGQSGVKVSKICLGTATFGVAPHDVHLDHVGLNHLTWETGVRLGGPDGDDMLPRLLAAHGDAVADDLHLPRPLLDRLGVVPSYYLRYYYAHDEVLASQVAPGAVSRAHAVTDVENELLALYADPSVDTKPEALTRRGGAFYSEAAVDLLASLTADRGDVQVVNVRNDGTLPFLPDDAVVEVPAVVDADGARPLPQRPVEPLYAGLIAHVTAYEQLALTAALHGGRDRVLDALLAHPLIGQLDLAEQLTDRLLANNREHLAWA